MELSAAEKEHYREQLSAILDYFRKLQELDTHDILPASSVLIDVAPLRPDEPRPGLESEQLLANAPEHEQNQFRVPPVFE